MTAKISNYVEIMRFPPKILVFSLGGGYICGFMLFAI